MTGSWSILGWLNQITGWWRCFYSMNMVQQRNCNNHLQEEEFHWLDFILKSEFKFDETNIYLQTQIKRPVDEMPLCQFTIRCSELFHINLRQPSIWLPDIWSRKSWHPQTILGPNPIACHAASVGSRASSLSSRPSSQVIITPQAVKLKLLNCVNASSELSLFPCNILQR